MSEQETTPVRVLRVFTDVAGRFGNPLGAIDGALVEEADRQRVAHELGFSETIFIDDAVSGELRIFTPGVELPLAGHPLVGAAWLLMRQRASGELLELRPPGGVVRAWSEADKGHGSRHPRHLAGLDARRTRTPRAGSTTSPGHSGRSTITSPIGPGSMLASCECVVSHPAMA